MQQRPEPVAVYIASMLAASAGAIFVRVEEGIPPPSSQQEPLKSPATPLSHKTRKLDKSQSKNMEGSRNETSEPVMERMSRRRVDRHRSKGKQFAALPFAEQNGEMLVMLVTSRETCRWVLPKGWAEKDLSGPELAAKEAFEEAGLVGKVATKSVGSYTYPKRLRRGRLLECKVKIFAVQVEHMMEDWPERHERERKWFTLTQAAMAVEEGDLIALLLQLAGPAT